MVATSAHHIVRVTVRIDVASFHRDIDVTLPTSSSFAEVLPELARLVDLPPVSRPWEVTTAAGAVLDPARPLYQQRLRDGQVVVLRPREPVPPPVVRDAAESLAATAEEGGRARGLDLAAACAGAAMLLLLVASQAGVAAGAASASAAFFVVAAAARSQISRALYALGSGAAAVAAGIWVAGPRDAWAGAADPAWGAAAASAALVTAAVAGLALSLADARVAAFLGTVAALAAAGSAAAFLPAPTAASAAVVLAGIVAVMLTPGIATRASGIAIPRVPTAGESFAVADEYQADVDDRARVARTVASGISAAVCLCCLPALVWLGFLGGGWVYAFTLCVAGALVLHAFRHHGAGPRVALALCAFGAVAASCVAVALSEDPHPVWVGAAFFLAMATLSAPLWAFRVPDLEPTTLVWLERAEMAAIIAVFPLGIHLLGVFDMIRGL